MGFKRFLMYANRLLRPVGLFILLLVAAGIADAQTYLDGPIQLQVRVREISCSDGPLSLPSIANYQSAMTYKVYADDGIGLSGLNFPGAGCLTDDVYLPGTSKDFNTTLFNYTYPTNSVPTTFRLKLFAFEDILPSLGNLTGFLGLCQGYQRCDYDPNPCCFGVSLFGACVGVSEADRNLCDASSGGNMFKINMDYRTATSPCHWKDWGLVTGTGCADYKPHIESFWRYTKGTACNNSIPLGTMCAGSAMLHYNSNECYSNNYAAAGGNDVFYAFDICSPIGIKASLATTPCPTCPTFNHSLTLLDANCNVLVTTNGNVASQASLSTYLCAPGPYHLVVDGATAADQGTFTLTLTEDTSLTFAVKINKSNVTCTGAKNGTAKAVISGGVQPYSGTLWSTGATTDSIGGLSPGTYGVTITDARGCTVANSTTITEPTPLTVSSITSTPVTCSGYRDGTATVNPVGGTTPYHYFWSGAPPQITQTATNLPAGQIAVTVLDSQGCYTLDSVTVTASTTIVNTLVNFSNVSCARAQDGLIDINITGGTPAYTYTWSNGAATQDVSNLDTGTYHVSVTDQNNCSITGTYHVSEPPELVVTINDSANARCNGGSDGAITIAAIGGTQPYTYLWSNGRTTQDLLNVKAGTYTVTVTDAHNCTDVLSHTITEPAAIVLVFDTASPACAGFSTGSIDLTVTGGTTPYAYLWTNNETTQDLVNLPSGAYGVLVTDSNNCFKFEFRSLHDPAPVDIQPPVVSHVSCNGASSGSINLIVNGGKPAYTYTWSPATVTGNNPTGLPSGFYHVTVSDQSGCKDSADIILTQASPILATVVSVDSVTCNGLSNGAINISVSGGTPTYTYAWSNGATTEDLNNVVAGNYNLTITDGSNCTATLAVTPTALGEPAILANTLTKVNPSCFGVPNGSISTAVTGGTAPYNYAWNTGATTPNITGLNGGQYSVLVTDAKGCTKFDTITIAPASQVNIAGSVTHLICNGQANGQIVLTVTGGTQPYTYNWTNGNQTASNTGLSGGYYQVTVADAQGCRAVDSFTVREPDALVLDLGSTDVVCFGDGNGVAFLKQMTGGTPPYTYDWSNGQTTAYATGLNPLTYSLKVTDANNCTVSGNVTVAGPQKLVAAIDSFHNNTCFSDNNGDVYVSATGGVVPYQFSVLNNVSQASGTFNNLPAGQYTAIVVDANNCRASDNFTITEPSDWSVKFKDPYIFVTRTSSTVLSPLLVDTVPGRYTFSWSPTVGVDCATCKNPKVTPVETTTYTVTATDSNGCIHTAEIVVVVKDEYDVYFPNAFSPNGDGNNDVWAPIDFGAVETINMRVYDRWGEIVFESNDISKGWDGTFGGKVLPSDVYAYQISGTLRNGKDFKKTGSISIMR